MSPDEIRSTVGTGEWYASVYPIVLSHARNFARNEQDAEDAVQDAFCRAHKNGNLLGVENPVGWLCRCARNAALDARRRKRPVPLTTDVAGALGGRDDGERNELIAAVRGLDQVSRDVIELYYEQRWSERLIGLQLFQDVSESAGLHRVRRIRLRAIDAIRRGFGGGCGEGRSG